MLENKTHQHLCVETKPKQCECFPSLKLVETDSADTHQNIESHHQRPSLPRSSPPCCIHPIQCAVSTQAQTQSASNDCFIDEARVYSLTQACNNYGPNQLEREGEDKKKQKKQNSEEASDGEALGEDLSYIYSGLNNALD